MFTYICKLSMFLYGIFFSSLKIVIVGIRCYFNVEITWSQKPLLDLVQIMMGWGEDIGNTDQFYVREKGLIKSLINTCTLATLYRQADTLALLCLLGTVFE